LIGHLSFDRVASRGRKFQQQLPAILDLWPASLGLIELVAQLAVSVTVYGGFFVGIRGLTDPIHDALQPSLASVPRNRNRPGSAHIPAYPMRSGASGRNEGEFAAGSNGSPEFDMARLQGIRGDGARRIRTADLLGAI
jgi:hypothetical protein